MKRSKKPLLPHRKSSTLHYQTFPTKPPTSRGRPLLSSDSNGEGSASHEDSESSGTHQESPLPKKQLAILAVIALAEQTALNSISPYLPDMASTFPEVREGQTGLYVGLIASSFALAQFTTNFFWGWLSDRIGRKPVVLIGTFLTACGFIAFGFSRKLWQAILAQVFMGLVNGNQAIISTCLGEITDRSNQSRAFTYLPVIYGIGGITGPIVGGLLVFERNPFNEGQSNPYPYLTPNLLSAGILLIDMVLTMIFLEESLDGAKDLPPLGARLVSLFTWLWQFSGASHRPTYLRNGYHADGSLDSDASDADSSTSAPALFPETSGSLSKNQIFNRDTILLLLTFLIFQLSNISYNSLYPIFAQAQPPTGRDLSPKEIGLSLGFAGLITIVFQVGIFGKVRERIGNKVTYRASLALFVVAFLLMPWVGYKDSPQYEGLSQGKVWLWVELGIVLVVKTVAAVMGLTSALLLVRSVVTSFSALLARPCYFLK